MLLVLAAALATAALPPPERLRIVRTSSGAVRFVRLHATVAGAGVRGTETDLIDLATGRTVERIVAGPLSSGNGYDGTRSWGADATGMPIVNGNAEDRRDAAAWAHFFGRNGPERPAIRLLAARGPRIVLRVTYPRMTGPLDVTVDRRNGTIAEVIDRSGIDVAADRFSDYRRIRGTVLPFQTVTTTRTGVWIERVRSVDFPAHVADAAFAPPPPPRDATLDGVSTVPIALHNGIPVVVVRIAGVPLRMLFDSGGSNLMTSRTARRLGVQLVGDDKTGGIGPGLVAERYATVARMEIGRASMRSQPFAVVDDPSMHDADGTIGCEVLQRFAVRFDFARRTVSFARDAALLDPAGTEIPIRFSGCQPEIDGGFDAFDGPIAIDTGSAFGLDVMSPFTRAHRLVARYHASATERGLGIGGASFGYLATARTLRLGPVQVRNVPIKLNLERTGSFADPSQLGNVGTRVLGKFTTMFDYSTNRMWLMSR
ncbi:hypothetical protein WPS_04550 [Vulcanimicrobium alpinum]|uniref:Peptidase A2 domain-containing protein n=2 Tax=Vulcanimicrobium alpinum TaxID=3016050 RepID=A0AAN1XT30_UNVUL|nr:hypothetical protein WPS_04550 [Vulcanimicrobium alpinum]